MPSRHVSTTCRHTGHRRDTLRATAIAGVLALLIALPGCKPGVGGGSGSGGGARAALQIDGETGAWTTRLDQDGGEESDAQFNRHGVATTVLLRARDGERYVEVHSTFLGQPSQPVFLNQKVSYRAADGTLFERMAPRDGNEGEGAIHWERLELDEDTRDGYAIVTLEMPVCVDQYTGPLEYETRCHAVSGTIRAPLSRARGLRVQP